MAYMDRYESWLNSTFVDEGTKEELLAIIENKKEIEDRFYKDLGFGTAGLRGILGAGTNRMNIYTVGTATQALSNYIVKWGERGRERGVVISYDSRNMSKEFAEHSACILCSNGIHVFLFKNMMPVPILSYAIRNMDCISGIMITASHNPPQYNGYKVYWKEGYQLTPAIAKDISEEINQIYDFRQINIMDKDIAMEKGLLTYVDDQVEKDYTKAILSQCLNKDMILQHGDELTVVYSPLYGSGLVPVKNALTEAGFRKVHIVEEQARSDGDFPTVNVPNPEDPEVFKLGKQLAYTESADIIIATDPDADRIGIAYKDNVGQYKNLSGNQIGCLLEYYVLSQMKNLEIIPDKGVVIKSIVTTDLAQTIADDFHIKLENTLTGFKYIGEKIEEYKNTKLKKFIMGFEESYGYLIGDHARDKDAVVTAVILCELALYYKLQKQTMGDVLENIYKTYGYYLDDIDSVKLEGKEGSIKIQRISDSFRRNLPMKWINKRVIFVEDYSVGKRTIVGEGVEAIPLPNSDVLKVYLEGDSWFCIRPSGTEPKIKIYYSIKGTSFEEAKSIMDDLKKQVMDKVEEVQNPN